MIKYLLNKYKAFSKPSRRGYGLLTRSCSIQTDSDTVVVFNQCGWSFTSVSIVKWEVWRWVTYSPKEDGYPYPRVLCGTKLNYAWMELSCPFAWYGWDIGRFVDMSDEELLRHARMVLDLYTLKRK